MRSCGDIEKILNKIDNKSLQTDASESSFDKDIVKEQLCNFFGNIDAKKEPAEDSLSLEEAFEKFDYFSEVISSNELLEHQMVITLGHDTKDLTSNKNIQSVKIDKENKKKLIPYIYKYNTSGKLCAIKATKEDLKDLKGMKFRTIQLGIPGTISSGAIVPYMYDAIQNIDNGLSKSEEKNIKNMLSTAQKKREKSNISKNFLSEAASRTPEESRAYLSKLKKAQEKKAKKAKILETLKHIWYVVIGKESIKIKDKKTKKFLSENKKLKEAINDAANNDIFATLASNNNIKINP